MGPTRGAVRWGKGTGAPTVMLGPACCILPLVPRPLERRPVPLPCPRPPPPLQVGRAPLANHAVVAEHAGHRSQTAWKPCTEAPLYLPCTSAPLPTQRRVRHGRPPPAGAVRAGHARQRAAARRHQRHRAGRRGRLPRGGHTAGRWVCAGLGMVDGRVCRLRLCNCCTVLFCVYAFMRLVYTSNPQPPGGHSIDSPEPIFVLVVAGIARPYPTWSTTTSRMLLTYRYLVC